VTANQFFIPSRDVDGSRGRLSGDEHHHLSRVARLRPGDEVGLFDESGTRYLGRIERIGPDATDVVLLSRESGSVQGVRLTLVQSVLKAKAMEAVVEKATELGVEAVIPLLSRRSVVRIEGSAGRQIERWGRIALAAAKQCRSGRVPRIVSPLRLERLLAGPSEGERLFLSEHGGTPLREVLAGPGRIRADAASLLVGPEGGWDPDEEAEMAAAGWRPVSLGDAILRADTAAVCGAAMIIHFWSA
jgi:16S rRNA (uracil1498-N3)-methyltransferase